MLIEEISIENYRSIKSLTIKIKNNVLQLIGENNTGKTNIFRAIAFFFESSVAGITKEDIFQKNLKNSIRITISFFKLNETESQFFEENLCNGKLIITKVISINEESERISSNFLITRDIPKIPHYDGEKFTDWKGNKEEIIEYFKSYNFEENLKNEKGNITKASAESVVSQFIGEKGSECESANKACRTNLKWREISKYLPEVLYIEATKKISEEVKTSERSKSIYKKILEKIIVKSIEENSEDSTLIKNFKDNLKRLKPFLKKEESEVDTRFEIIKKLERDILSNLNENITTNSIKIKTFPPTLKDIFTNTDILVNDGIESSIENKGDGLKRSLIFSLFITYSDYLRNVLNEFDKSDYKPFLFLIEEPELYLHPQAQKSLRDTLNLISEYDQVFYSTHSSNFIDIGNYLSIGVTDKVSIELGTKVSFIENELFDPQPKSEYELLMRFKPERNEMFFAKKVVLVEGNVEKIVLFHAADLLGNNYDKLNFSIIECGGKTMLSYFLKIISCYNKTLIVIHDIDPLSSEEDKPADKLREMGYNDKEIQRIKEKKNIFAENSKLLDLISKKCDKIGLIVINPNFEKLIGITQHGDKKTFKAFKYAKNLTKENIDLELQKITDFILNFNIDNNRQVIEKCEIEYISNNEESHLEEDLSQTDEMENDVTNFNQKSIVERKEQVKLDSFF